MKVHIWGCDADREHRVRKHNARFQLNQGDVTSNRVVHFICRVHDHLVHLKPLGVTACKPEVHQAHIYIKSFNALVPVGTENKGTVT